MEGKTVSSVQVLFRKPIVYYRYMGIIRTLIGRVRRIPIPVIFILLILLVGGWYMYKRTRTSGSSSPSYLTAKAQRGTVISSVTASGQVATSNSTSVTTQTSGVIKKIYVKDGDIVKAGDAIADVDLDLQGKQRAAQSLASYQNAKNSLQSAKDKYYSLQSSMMAKWKTYMDTAQNDTYENPDGSENSANRNLPQFFTVKDDWLATEADYKIQEQVITQAQTNLNNAWLSYQQTSPTIYAPISGTVTGLSLQVGSFITAQSNSSGGSSAQRIANIMTEAPPTITVNVTEVDTPKIAIGDKATVTFDAFPDKTFTGSVVSIDTVGAVTSGVTSYPTTIKLDVPESSIYPNMAAQAMIISNTKTDVVTVPSTAVKNRDGSSYVLLMGKDGKPQEQPVETGLSSDTVVEIVSGLSEGETVITNTVTSGSTPNASGQARSIFGGGNGFVRMGR